MTKPELEFLKNSNVKAAEFAVDCNCKVIEYNIEANGAHFLDLPDAVAMSVVLWPDIVSEKRSCTAYVCLHDPETYGQVIFNDGRKLAIQEGYMGKTPNAELCTVLNNQIMKERMIHLLVSKRLSFHSIFFTRRIFYVILLTLGTPVILRPFLSMMIISSKL